MQKNREVIENPSIVATPDWAMENSWQAACDLTGVCDLPVSGLVSRPAEMMLEWLLEYALGIALVQMERGSADRDGSACSLHLRVVHLLHWKQV